MLLDKSRQLDMLPCFQYLYVDLIGIRMKGVKVLARIARSYSCSDFDAIRILFLT